MQPLIVGTRSVGANATVHLTVRNSYFARNRRCTTIFHGQSASARPSH
jgi:hypothetical protein